MKTFLAALLCVATLPGLAQLPGNAHRFTPTSNDSDRGATVVTFTADADCDITTKTNCTVVGNTAGFDDGQYLGTLNVATGSGVTLTADRKVTVPGGPGRDYHVFNTTAGSKQACVTTASSSVIACAPNGIAKPVYVVTGNGTDYYVMGATPLPLSAKVLGSDALGQPQAASSSDIQSVIGASVYDASGAAAAAAAAVVAGLPTSLPPNGAAGGDLCGSSSYPSPKVCNVGATSGSPGTGGVPVHASTLKSDSLAGSTNNVVATTALDGTVGKSNVILSSTFIPGGNTLGFVTIQANNISFTGTLSSGSSIITSVSSVAGLVVGQVLSGAGIATGATITVIGSTTVTMSLNATLSGTMISLFSATGTATQSYTTGINDSCAGNSTSCLVQQINFAPCATVPTITGYVQNVSITLSSLTCTSPSGIGEITQFGSDYIVCSWSGQNTSTNQLTGLQCGLLNSSNPSSLAVGTNSFPQINLSYSTSGSAYPFEVILQNGAHQYSYSGKLTTVNADFGNCSLAGDLCFWNAPTFFRGANFYLASSTAQVISIQGAAGLLHDDMTFSNVAGSNTCLGEFIGNGAWHYGVAGGNCTFATNGIDPNVSFTGNITTGSVTITNVSSFAGLAVGEELSGTGIRSLSTISALDPVGDTVTMNATASATATGQSVTALILDVCYHFGFSSGGFSSAVKANCVFRMSPTAINTTVPINAPSFLNSNGSAMSTGSPIQEVLNTDSLTSSASQYAPLFHATSGSSTYSGMPFYVTANGTLTNFKMDLPVDPGSGITVSHFLVDNGSTTAFGCMVTGNGSTATSCSYSGVFAIVSGHQYDWLTTTSAASAFTSSFGLANTFWTGN